MDNTEAFEQIAAGLTSPMIIVTARHGDEIDGCLVGFSTQCSIDPTRYLVCLSKRNNTYRIALCATSVFVYKGGIVRANKVEAQHYTDPQLEAAISATEAR